MASPPLDDDTTSGGSPSKKERSFKIQSKKRTKNNMASPSTSPRNISSEQWRLILLLGSMVVITILQVGFFHVQYQPDVQTIPDAPLVSRRRPPPPTSSSSAAVAAIGSRSSTLAKNATMIESSSSPLISSNNEKNAPKQQQQQQQPQAVLVKSSSNQVHGKVRRAKPNQENESSMHATRTTTTTTSRTISKEPPANKTLAIPSVKSSPSHPTIRFDVLARRRGPKPQFPPDFSRTESVIDILQNTSFDLSSLQSLQLELNTNMLGILVDAGRHYFTIEWLKRLIDVLAVLQYNLIHFRLTDDQAFAIQLESQPDLACPTHIYGNTKVYTRQDIRELIGYARTKNITIIPEINIPGHAGGWMGIPGLVIPCRNHACSRGYALPLNISHPDIRSILTDVIREVVDIFENPPYLHLGGDEMELAKPCFDEVGAELFDYNDFEGMLQEILQDVGYPEEQVIRWRETSFAPHSVRNTQRLKAKKRAGMINHWWHDTPGKTENVTIGTPIIGSARLYMDVNFNEAAWEVFLHSRKWWHLGDVFAQNAPVNLKGIIVGGFELDANFFHDRNVVGRLLAVTIGVSNLPILSGNELNALYARLCHQVGFPEGLCRKYGHPMIDYYGPFKSKWSNAWREWKRDVCVRFTMQPKAIGMKNNTNGITMGLPTK